MRSYDRADVDVDVFDGQQIKCGAAQKGINYEAVGLVARYY